MAFNKLSLHIRSFQKVETTKLQLAKSKKSLFKNIHFKQDSKTYLPCEIKQLSWKSVSLDFVSGSSGASAHFRLKKS